MYYFNCTEGTFFSLNLTVFCDTISHPDPHVRHP
jgi:hypothetical protein